MIGREVTAGAVEMERALLGGRALGLTDEEAREVVEEALTWASERGVPVPWGVVHDVMARRAIGVEWRL